MGEKKWRRETFIKVFGEEILPHAESLRRNYFRNHPNPTLKAFWSAMNKTKEITYVDLYSLFGLDYEEIKNQPHIWTRDKIISFMKKIISDNNRVRINPTFLAEQYEFFYAAIRRSKIITFEELYAEVGLTYSEQKRKKRYQNKEDVKKKLKEYQAIGIRLKPIFIRQHDIALYNYLLQLGKGSFGEALKDFGVNVQFDLPVIKQVGLNQVRMDYKFFNKGFKFVLAYRFEDIVDDILTVTQSGFYRNSRVINGCIPDFIDNSMKVWLDAKFSTAEINRHIVKNKYSSIAKKVIYIYFRKNQKLINSIPSNVEIYSIWEYVERFSKEVRDKFLYDLYSVTQLLDIFDLINNLEVNQKVDITLMKNSSNKRNSVQKELIHSLQSNAFTYIE